MTDQLDVFGNGRVKLYRRGAKGIYQVRVKIPGALGHTIQTTDTAHLPEAITFASNLYDDLLLKVKQGGTIRSGPTFKQVFEEWEKLNPSSVHIDRITSHALPHFGKHKIDQIKQTDFTAYWYERKAKGRTLPKSGTIKPITNGTLKRERTAILPIFTYAKAKGYIKELPDSNLPDTLKPEKNNRRPVFTKAEWAKITRNMREWLHPTGF